LKLVLKPQHHWELSRNLKTENNTTQTLCRLVNIYRRTYYFQHTENLIDKKKAERLNELAFKRFRFDNPQLPVLLHQQWGIVHYKHME